MGKEGPNKAVIEVRKYPELLWPLGRAAVMGLPPVASYTVPVDELDEMIETVREEWRGDYSISIAETPDES